MSYEIILPKASLTMTEGTIIEWLMDEGASVKAGETIARIETDKVILEVESPGDGLLVQLHKEEAVLPVASVMGYVLQPGEKREDVVSIPQPAPKEDTEVMPPKSSPPQKTTLSGKKVKISPLARKMALELGVDHSKVVPTSPSGKISTEDIERAAARQKETSDELTIDPGQMVQNSIPLRGMRGTIAKRMQQSSQNNASVTLNAWADVTQLVSVRDDLKKGTPSHNLEKITYDSILAAATAQALSHHPRINSRLMKDVIEELQMIHVSVAVDTPRGLMTVVVRNTDKKSLVEISKELETLVNNAMNGKASAEDMEGSTFTITNMGMFGVTHFTPIIQPSQCAILGVGAIVEMTRFEYGKCVPWLQMPLSLTFDHRIVDGAPAARFLQEISQLLETPAGLLMMNTL
jgi:pyruvate dehydrogenase E2 component (dihydrolipoamide acetyltransferase)